MHQTGEIREHDEGSGGRYRRLDPEAWLRTLLLPQTRVGFYYAALTQHARGYVVRGRMLGVHMLWYVDRGTGTGEAVGRHFTLGPGSALWIAPGVPHDLTVAPLTRIWTLRPQFYHEGRRIRPRGDCICLRKAFHLRPHFEQVLGELQVAQPFGGERVRALLALLAIGFWRGRARGGEETPGPGIFDEEKRLRLARLVAESSGKPLRTRDLSRALRLSHDYFARVFLRTFGVAPRTWLVHERLRTAAHLLEGGGRSIKAVAYETGYRNVNLFSRQFAQHYGCSPMAFARQADVARVKHRA